MASGECVVKINEVILEALNTKTGAPNGGTRPGYQNDEVHVDPKTGEADFSGLTQAAQGAKMLGRGAQSVGKGIARGATAVGGAIAQGAKNVGGAIANTLGTDPVTGRPRTTLGYLARDFVGDFNYDAAARRKIKGLLAKGDEWLNAPDNAKPNLSADEQTQINKLLQQHGDAPINWEGTPTSPTTATTPATPAVMPNKPTGAQVPIGQRLVVLRPQPATMSGDPRRHGWYKMNDGWYDANGNPINDENKVAELEKLAPTGKLEPLPAGANDPAADWQKHVSGANESSK